jgi:hypothetical protein
MEVSQAYSRLFSRPPRPFAPSPQSASILLRKRAATKPGGAGGP